MPKIMALPMSHRDIQPILERARRPAGADGWKGGLPLNYRLGGEARATLQIDMRTDVQPNYVVEGRLRGSERPDEWVVLGNHHDAWVFGGVDPSSGTASMMELTRALGKLASEGMRPRRTLVFGSWDGEEVTLTGSTEWGEQFVAELRQKAVAYLNVDSSASGPASSVSAVGSLAPMVVELTGELRDPSGVSLHEAWRRPADESEAVRPRACCRTRRWSSRASAAARTIRSSSITSACRWSKWRSTDPTASTTPPTTATTGWRRSATRASAITG